MRRRQFIALFGGVAMTWPLAAGAQQRELRRVAILAGGGRDTPGSQERVNGFLEALEQLGWTDGRNVQIVVRWAEGDDVKARKYAEELVAFAPDVILATGSVGAPRGPIGPLMSAARAAIVAGDFQLVVRFGSLADIAAWQSSSQSSPACLPVSCHRRSR